MIFGRKRKLARVLGDYELPTFPAIVLQTLQRLRDEDADNADVAEVLAGDPGLTQRVIATVNSAAFSPVRRVGDVEHAIALLGRAAVESLVLGAGVQRVLPKPKGVFNATRFWGAAALRASVARALAQRIDRRRTAVSFTAALLQDMAIPVMAHVGGRKYERVLQAWHADEIALADAERDAFGWDHAEVGAMLCESWSFPASLRDAVRGHHGDEGDEPLGELPPAVTLVADLSERGDPEEQARLIEQVQDLGMAPDETVAVLADARERAEDLARLLAA